MFFATYSIGQKSKTDSLIQLAENQNHDTLKLKYYWNIIGINASSNPLIAGQFVTKFKKICEENFAKYPKHYVDGLIKLSQINRELGRLSEVVPLINSAMRIADSLGNKRLIANVYSEKGNLYINTGDYKSAQECFLKDIQILKSINPNDPEIYGVYNNLGIVYAQSNNLNKAEEYFKQALQYALKLNNYVSLGNCYNNIGIIRMIKGVMDSSLYYVYKGKEYREKTNDQANLAGSYNNIASYYKIKKNYNLAAKFADTSYAIAVKIHSKQALIEVLQTYYEICDVQGNFKDALKYYKEKQLLTQELENENVEKKIAEYQGGYELEKKEKELNESKNQLLLKEAKEGKQKVKINLLIVILIVSVAGIVLVINRNKKISAANKIISDQKVKVEEQKQIIEEKHKDITDSINYAQKIQTALIISENKLSAKVNNVFVMFKPRDIVSGDFYWYSEKNGYKLLAVADCTGHGVPGAFMSMIGITLLNQIVNEKGIVSPAEILNHLKEGIVSSLNPTGDISDKRDGMDISVIAWNNNELYFAGANNPCVAICNNELIDLKPDKQPVGLYEKNEKFTEQKLIMQGLQSIYLFTDGIVDQFGGTEGKKLKLKLFRQWLVEISGMNSIEQKHNLENKLINWMGKHEQIDDILVIGIKA